MMYLLLIVTTIYGRGEVCVVVMVCRCVDVVTSGV